MQKVNIITFYVLIIQTVLSLLYNQISLLHATYNHVLVKLTKEFYSVGVINVCNCYCC